MRHKKAKALIARGKDIRQVAALPYREDEDGEIEICLVTSRETRRFIIPKGWPMQGLEDWQAAEIEAREEAGVVGEAERQSCGVYSYWKRIKGAFVPVKVDVFPLEVVGDLPWWKEGKQRRRGWVSWRHATELVDEPQLIDLIERFAQSR